MIRLILPLAFLAFFTASCSNSSKSDSSEETEATVEEHAAIDDQHASADAVTAYMSLKEAMVSSNAETGADAAKVLSEEMQKLAGSDSIANVIIVASDSLSMSSDLEMQRSAFQIISDNLYIYLKENGYGREIYHQRCPMAFNNRGAFWLSDKEEIENPYLPETMLKCGQNVEVLEL